MKKLELKKLIKEAVKLHLEELETNERKNVSKRAGVFCKCGGDPIFFCPYGSCSHPRCACSEEGVPPIAVKRGEIMDEDILQEGPMGAAKKCGRCLDSGKCCKVSGTSSNPHVDCIPCLEAPTIDRNKGMMNEEEQLNEEWSAEQCSRSWDKVTDMGGDPQGMSIFRKFCCRRGWKCCTRKRPKRNPCWD